MYSEPKTVSALFGLICELISQIKSFIEGIVKASTPLARLMLFF
mgnify:CR=1 FL=1